jgi:outer membrane protein
MNKVFDFKFWLILILSVGLSFVLTFFTKGPELVYVDNVRLFADFEMSKELNAQLEKTTKKKQDQLDSLNFGLESMDMQFKNGNRSDSLVSKFKFQKMELDKLSERYAQEYTSSEQQYNSSIWKQLSQYLKEFSEKQGYDILVGASGDGTVMYGNKRYEITDDLIKYANEKYAGSTK